METLASLYPDIGINRAKFKTLPSNIIIIILYIIFMCVTCFAGNHFQDLNNRKVIFDDFAKEYGFDPLLAENWYKIKKRQFIRHKVNIIFIVPSFIIDLFHSLEIPLFILIESNRVEILSLVTMEIT